MDRKSLTIWVLSVLTGVIGALWAVSFFLASEWFGSVNENLSALIGEISETKARVSVNESSIKEHKSLIDRHEAYLGQAFEDISNVRIDLTPRISWLEARAGINNNTSQQKRDTNGTNQP